MDTGVLTAGPADARGLPAAGGGRCARQTPDFLGIGCDFFLPYVCRCLRLPACARAAGPGPPGARATVLLSLDALPTPDPAPVPGGFLTGVFKEPGMRSVLRLLSTENHLGFIKSHCLTLHTKSTSDASDFNVKK